MMKKLMVAIVVAALLACSGNALAEKSQQEQPEGPVVIGVIIQLPDGTIKIIPMQPKEDSSNTSAPTSDVKTEVILIPPIIILPPINIWQLGLFYYVSVPFYGWRGPNGFDYIMTVDLTGIRHDWVWLGFWYYLGAS